MAKEFIEVKAFAVSIQQQNINLKVIALKTVLLIKYCKAK